MARFKLVRVMMGSGWPSGHIAVDKHYTFPDKAGGSEFCLTLDAQNAEELAKEVDDLVAELLVIKEGAARHFARWQSAHDKEHEAKRDCNIAP